MQYLIYLHHKSAKSIFKHPALIAFTYDQQNSPKALWKTANCKCHFSHSFFGSDHFVKQ